MKQSNVFKVNKTLTHNISKFAPHKGLKSQQGIRVCSHHLKYICYGDQSGVIYCTLVHAKCFFLDFWKCGQNKWVNYKVLKKALCKVKRIVELIFGLMYGILVVLVLPSIYQTISLNSHFTSGSDGFLYIPFHFHAMLAIPHSQSILSKHWAFASMHYSSTTIEFVTSYKAVILLWNMFLRFIPMRLLHLILRLFLAFLRREPTG